MVARRVRWRSGRSRSPEVSRSRAWSRRCSSFAGSRMRTRAAANSRARGKPSRRRQMELTASALLPDNWKSGLTRLARCTNSVTDGHACRASRDSSPASGSARGGRGYSNSAPTFSGARLVDTTCRPGQRDTRSASPPAASSTCSRLSRTSRTRCSPITVERASRAVRPWASAISSAMLTVGRTSAASVTETRDTKAAPPAYAAA